MALFGRGVLFWGRGSFPLLGIGWAGLGRFVSGMVGLLSLPGSRLFTRDSPIMLIMPIAILAQFGDFDRWSRVGQPIR